jgi:hypothetical protein
MKSAEDCKSLLVDIDAVQQWYGENGMELNIQKTKILSFTRKTNSTSYILNTLSKMF